MYLSDPNYTWEPGTLAAKRSAGSENPGWRRVAPYPGYAVVPLFCLVAATPYPTR
ncbi:hypothetical protein [Klebsiella variicola]|uniref:hypothetical protein n=1 Tax=Klebsiella variicola TaxID=244366 RepID=UPI0038D1C4FF